MNTSTVLANHLQGIIYILGGGKLLPKLSNLPPKLFNHFSQYPNNLE